MKRLIALLAIALCSAACLAQRAPVAPMNVERTPEAEIFGGFSYIRMDDTGIGSGHSNLLGWNATATGNFTHWLGFDLDASGYYGTPTVNVGGPPMKVQMRNHLILGGPRVSLRRVHYTLYARGMAGFYIPWITDLQGEHWERELALSAGGGFDWNISRHWAVRIVQADYIYTHSFNANQNHMRVSTGIVYRFGRRD